MLPEWKWAKDVLKGIEKGREYKCLYCPFPLRPNEAVLYLDGRWSHAFCVNELEGAL